MCVLWEELFVRFLFLNLLLVGSNILLFNFDKLGGEVVLIELDCSKWEGVKDFDFFFRDDSCEWELLMLLWLGIVIIFLFFNCGGVCVEFLDWFELFCLFKVLLLGDFIVLLVLFFMLFDFFV